jgi:hypothetical protein
MFLRIKWIKNFQPQLPHISSIDSDCLIHVLPIIVFISLFSPTACAISHNFVMKCFIAPSFIDEDIKSNRSENPGMELLDVIRIREARVLDEEERLKRKDNDKAFTENIYNAGEDEKSDKSGSSHSRA